MLGQLSFNEFGKTSDRLKTSIERMKFFEPIALRNGGYYLNYSRGKDSIATKLVADLAGVKYTAHYNITGIDPPEIFQEIKNMTDVIMHQHEKSFFQLVYEKLMPPTRITRYCCDKLKEHGGEDKFNVTGVRWAESKRRKKTRNVIEFDRYGSKSKKAIEQRTKFLTADNDEKRRILETGMSANGCRTTGKNILNPIVDWSDEDVWEVIKYYGLTYPSLYDEGFKRIGCIGCPLSTKTNRIREFKRYPKFKENYIRCFERMIKHRLELEKPTQWKSGEEVFEWWLNG